MDVHQNSALDTMLDFKNQRESLHEKIWEKETILDLIY